MIKLMFLGDVMCKLQMLQVYNKSDSYDFSEVFSAMEKYFKKSDMVVANLETPISRDNSKLTQQQYNFSSPYEFAKAMYDSGVECVSTANNHCLDRGIEGIISTIDCLDEIGVKHTGTYKYKDNEPLILNVNGVKLGFLSYTYGTNAFANNCYLNSKEKYHVNLFQNQELSNPITRYCYNNRNNMTRIYNKIIRLIFKKNSTCQVYERKEFDFKCKKKLKSDIKNIKKAGAELVIMLMHSGGQYNESVSENTQKLSKFLVKEGVDIVVGNHEHVVHGGIFNKIDNNKLIAYSLGNFDGIAGVYEKPFDKMAEYSIAWYVYIEKNEDKRVKIKKTTFTVLKTIGTNSGGIQTIPVYELIKKEEKNENRNRLIKDMIEIAYRFSNKKYNSIQEEYEI